MQSSVRTVVLIAFILTAVCGAFAPAQNAVPLALKFSPGELLQYDVSFSGSGGVNVPGEKLAAVGVQGSLFLTQRVLEVLPDGSGRLETRVPRFQVEVSIAQERVSFSFDNGRMRWFANGRESTPPADADISKLPLLMAPVIVTVAPDGRTVGMSFADPQLMAQLSQVLPGFNLEQLSGQSTPLFPSHPVAVGETWRQSVQMMPIGPMMPITASVSRTLDSYQDQGGIGVAKISGFAETTARMQGSQLLPLPGAAQVAIPEMRQTVTSTEFFNATKGQLLRGEYDIGFNTQFSVGAAAMQKSGSVEARFRMSMQAR